MSGVLGGLPFEMGAEGVIASLIGIVTLLLSVTIISTLSATDGSSRRARMLRARRATLKENAKKPSRVSAASRSHADSLAGLIIAHLRKAHRRRSDSLTQSMLRAGWRTSIVLDLYLLAKFFGPAAAFTGVVIFFSIDGTVWRHALWNLTFAIGAAGAAAFSPDLLLRNAISRREKKIQESLPDGLDLMVICAEAGLSMEHALNRVSEELTFSARELSEELTITALELNFLPERRQALLNLAGRVDIPSVRSVVSTLIQTEKYGTPLSQSLKILSSEFRAERLLRAEEKAARLPATLTVPMILFILPTLFIVLAGPAVLDVYDSLVK